MAFEEQGQSDGYFADVENINFSELSGCGKPSCSSVRLPIPRNVRFDESNNQ